jgi:hypothetical protein
MDLTDSELGPAEASYEHNSDPPGSTPVLKRLIEIILISIDSLRYYRCICLSGQMNGYQNSKSLVR